MASKNMNAKIRISISISCIFCIQRKIKPMNDILIRKKVAKTEL